jgi:dipeptidyl aminopeptidase/acylaminoacyl peptidase
MKKLFLIFAVFMLACGVPGFFAEPTPVPVFDTNSIGTTIAETANAAFTQTQFFVTPSSTPTLTPSVTPTATFTATPTSTRTATPTITSTPTIYEKYTIDALRARIYGGGDLTSVRAVRKDKNSTTYLAKYSSDGIPIYALVITPNDTKIRAVVITIHGYMNAGIYDLYQDSGFIDSAFARQGYITIHPAMRNYPPSGDGDNLFRVGQTIDVLNLIAIVKAQAGKPGLLEYADANRIGLEGSSTGGGVALRAMTVTTDIKATVLYSSISGDERRNVPLFQRFAHDPQFAGEPVVSDLILARISPASYYDSITAHVLLAHGMNDATVPVDWAKETCFLLETARVKVSCNFYQKAGHSFTGPTRATFLERAVAFYNLYLR